jgi:phosphate transport system ATP-binding protein
MAFEHKKQAGTDAAETTATQTAEAAPGAADPAGMAGETVGISHDDESKLGPIAIETRELAVYYGKNQALRHANLKFPKNEITALIGPSGCGKSTFLRCLNLMNRQVPHCRIEGEIIFDGRNINTKTEDVYKLRKRIGMVFQKPNPFAKSIYENIAFPLRQHGMAKKSELDDAVRESLEAASLWEEVSDKLQDSALSLSGGQQQRLCIARTLALKPEVMLLDEPCSALDPHSTLRIEELLTQLKDEYTIVIVTHNLQQAWRIASRTVFFHLGNVVEWGPTAIMYTDPTDPRTASYLSGRFG